MNAVDLIASKRSGRSHTPEELEYLVTGATSGSIPRYQLSAWLMAVCWRGLNDDETSALTLAMARSGQMLDLGSRWSRVVDKHSTGGVGDKTTLVLAPMLAAAGCRVAKMSGRGLGFSGGTIDKLESIPGFRAELESREFLDQVERIGIAISAQSRDLAPADGVLYALRDATATVDSIPLIASSVMSKKLALGAKRLVLDVKTGAGAFMRTDDEARRLARTMVSIGRAAGIRTSAVMSNMDQPEGFAVGNALELREAIAALKGEGPPDLLEICLKLGSQLEVESLEDTISDGSALVMLRRMIEAQGGDPRVIEQPARLPSAPSRRPLLSPRGGWVAALNAEAIGRAALLLGAGRLRHNDAVDPAVGVLLRAKIGDRIERGQEMAELHLSSTRHEEEAARLVASAFRLSEEPVAPPATVREVIG